MTIVRRLPSQLILAHAPWWAGAALIVWIVGLGSAALVLLAAGETRGVATLAVGALLPGAIFALMIKRDQVIFDKAAGTVTHQRQTLLRYRCETFALDDVACADVQQISDTARPIILLRRGRHDTGWPLVEAYRTGNGPRRAAEAINTWLDATP